MGDDEEGSGGMRARCRRWLPADAGWTLAAIATLLLASAAIVGHRTAPLAAVPLILAGTAMLLGQLGRQAACERLAAALCDAEGQRLPLTETLPRIAARIEATEHRATRSHPVTGLPTREALFAAMAEDIARGGGAALLGSFRFADFDRLAAFDMDSANRALAALARRLGTGARAEHVTAQVDRDCFAVWLRGDLDAEAALAEFRAIVYMAMQEIEDGDSLLTPVIEAGMAFYPEDGHEPALLLNRAIVALARPQPKETGDIALIRAPSMQAAREAFALEQDLAQAIEEGQLDMLFQPVVDVAEARIVSAEALLRWDHPTLGPVSPARFIPLVETIGLADRYGAWVLNTACREAKRWRDAGLAGCRVAVNLSARQLLDQNLLAKIERTLARHGLAPDALELELTETAAMADAGRTLRLFGELHAMGISLAIDDFGSGYSSLSYLKNLPFDKLKIDREFVRGAHLRRDSLAICRALVELGRGLDLRVLAEGVEEADEVAALRALGCTLFQGYYFARPLAGDAFLALARDDDWAARTVSPVHRQLDSLEGRLSA